MRQEVDQREALYNDRPVGPAGVIQVPVERITTLHGFVVDLDPVKLDPDNPLFPPADSPRAFHQAIGRVLARHPLFRDAEVRVSGTGLHLVVHLASAVELKTAADQQRWKAVVRAAQSTLPADPDAPGVTALTRPVGSINSKNGAAVEVIAPGEPVDPSRVVEFVEGLAAAPFRTVATILLGADRFQPCPACRGEGTRLDVLDQFGWCYGGCSKVSLERLFDLVYRPEPRSEKPRAGAGEPRRRASPRRAIAAKPPLRAARSKPRKKPR
ncbi:hypothetical protein [Paludisphaera soli]|uniref:hypothetical protein n=1 Tax=Paludisphaera soli TaxID=2712865 RepID=UPI0013EA53DF|nr:hypothetical protein [Paludisphaera soli]